MAYSDVPNADVAKSREVALIVCAVPVLGIFLPYLSGPFGIALFNVPWSIAYGIIPYAADRASAALSTVPPPHWLEVAAVISSPIVITGAVFKVASRLQEDKRKRVWIIVFVFLALLDVPSSVVFDYLTNLPFYQRYFVF